MVMSIEAGKDAFQDSFAIVPQIQLADQNANNPRIGRNQIGRLQQNDDPSEPPPRQSYFRTTGRNCPRHCSRMQFSMEEIAGLLPFDAIISNALPARLIPLVRAKHFFIQSAPLSFDEEFTSKRKVFNILDCNGDRVFILEDMSRTKCCGCQKILNIVIRGSSGDEMMSIRGNPSGRCFMNMSNPEKPICSIEEHNSCCSTEKCYRIRDEEGRMIYKVSNDYSGKNTYDFEVTTFEGTRIGKLSKTWIGLPPKEQSLAHSYGVAFPNELLVQDKISLLGAMIILNLKYVEDRGQLQRRGESQCLFCVFCCLIIFACFLTLGLVGVLMYRDWVK